MKKYLPVFLFLIFLNFNLLSQIIPPVAVQNGNQAKFFTNIQNAIDSADAGSSIYLPASIPDYHYTGNLTINKKLHIYAVGHYPDSTSGTGRIIIDGNVNIIAGADSGSINGLYVNGDIKFGTTSGNQNVSNYLISRCRMNNLYLGVASPASASFITVSECLLYSYTTGLHPFPSVTKNLINGCIYGNNISSYVQIDKNIIGGEVKDIASNCVFVNNIFLKYTGIFYSSFFKYCAASAIKTLSNINNCLFENNIFLNSGIYAGGYLGPSLYTCGNTTSWYFSYLRDYFLYNCSNNMFNNNIFEADPGLPYGTNIGNDSNIVNQSHSQIFENFPDTVLQFDYSYNFHLNSNSPGKNHGTDETDIGIYGSSVPFKEGAVPIIPHIQSIITTPIRVTNKTLHIEMKVNSQTR